MIIGIDPGFTGAIAFLSEHDTIKSVVVEDLPLKMIMDRKQIDGKRFAKLVRRVHAEIKFAAIEDVASMPGQGVASTFRFGFNAGVLHGVLESLDIKIIRIKPAVWKSALNLTSNKKKSLALARQLWPVSQDLFARAKDDGRAEAALIAHFAKVSIL